MIFFVGLHQPSDAKRFDRCCISVNRLRDRRSLAASEVLLDSGAFTEISTYGRYRHTVAEYAAEVRRISGFVRVAAAVAQDWMCEPFIVAKTGLSVEQHQQLTIERYDALVAEDLSVAVMPVLQGYQPADYVRHLRSYGNRLGQGAWVGVGSVCKRNSSPMDILNVLSGIARERPDLRLHGFGVKRTALLEPSVRAYLSSADSMAWSFAARKAGRNGNDWREAERFIGSIDAACREPAIWRQMPLFV